MQSASEPNHPPTSGNEAAVEVEEAELSSDGEMPNPPPRSRKRTTPADEDFVLDDDDDDDGEDIDDDLPYLATSAESPGRDRRDPEYPQRFDGASATNNSDLEHTPQENQHHSISPAVASGSTKSRRDNDSSAASSASDDSSGSDGTPSSEEEDDGEPDHVPSGSNAIHRQRSSGNSEDDEPSHHESHVDNNGDEIDSDSQSASTVRRGTRRRGRRLVIPDDMKDDDQFFRRSGRSRAAPERLSISPADSPSESLGSDSEYNADAAHEEEDEEEEVYDLDDEDYTYGSRRKTRASRKRDARTARRPRRAKSSESEPALQDEYSESDSDGEWREGPQKKSIGRRKRKKSKRQRSRDVVADEDVARTARINTRTGGTVNYCESGDDFFDSDENLPAAGAVQVADDGAPEVDKVVDYRPLEGAMPGEKIHPLFSDFDQNHVEFSIKWIGKSFRRCTWETWSTLQNFKGSKKVQNYIKRIQEKQAYFRSDKASPEDEEAERISLEEERAASKRCEVVERVVAQRESEEGNSQTEYLVKWLDLAYCECTWETHSELTSEADLKAIDDYKDREQQVLANAGKKRYNPFNTKDDRPRFKRMLEQPGYLHGEGRTLRDYQLAGLNFLAFSWTKRNNVILADEMGLGKTLQTISFLGWLMYMRNVTGPFLVVVPLSTIAAWVREFARWLPDMNVICYTGNAKSRARIREFEFWSTARTSTEKFHTLLITPELLMMDQIYLESIRWAMIAVDEAHRLKNETSALHITLANLRSANRLLITGTPLQNSVRELWALLHFLNPDVFGSAEEFEDSFSFAALRDPERVANLHRTLRPYIIRRQKTDVEKSLPKKSYAVLRVGMTSSQQQYYRWLLTKNFTQLNAGGKGRGMGTTSTLRNLVVELKKCCNHLFLFPNYEDTSVTTTVDQLIKPSGKLILLDKLLIRLKEKGHRVLIFSQMVRMLDILQDYCRMRNFAFQRLDGSIQNEVRQQAVDHFNAPESSDFVFLLSTRAGGLGINLATADTVIIFDSDWNPQNDLQAESRAHRIGQTKDVKVFRLISRETVEEDILERAKRKRVLEHLVIHGVEGGDQGDGKDGKMAFKKEELSAILRFGAEKLFEKEKQSVLGQGSNGKETGDGKRAVDATTNGTTTEEPSAVRHGDNDRDDKAEERRVMEVDDIDELLARAPTDEASQVGGAQPSIGDSLLNAFKWADFKTVEEEEADEDEQENKRMATDAANRLAVRDEEASKAQLEEQKDREKVSREGDQEFWNRVIPADMKNDAIVNDMVLGTRRRKRTETFNADSPQGKRRRVARSRTMHLGKVMDVEELSEKEQRSFFRSMRKFGDPDVIITIIRDAGLEDRLDEEFARNLFSDILEKARVAVEEARLGRSSSRKKTEDSDPEYDSREDRRQNGKDAKSKSSRILFNVLSERDADAADLLKRCKDLQMLREHISTFDSDIQFRFRNVIKLPAYGIRWKGQNDAMLLVGVCRHGFGNWTQIAGDKQLGLADKINVAGNPESKPGAPDTTKLTRRIQTLLRELEKEVRPVSTPKRSRARERSGRTKSRKTPKIAEKKISKARQKDAGSSRSGVAKRTTPKSKKGRSKKSNMKEYQIALKTTHIATLKELRDLSKENNKLDNSEKIRMTKECLLKLGRAISRHSDERTRKELWNFVHEVCRTSLPGDRLHGIYERLAGVESSRA
eukprot:GFKZ01014809.1.p1 GENE.GFKZ01014809.1~~GFKZ01014809.1.p1  ORF type:complete len:1687 (+),score=291.31 GFKZ01014809.1:317-5377(+)